MTEDNTQAFPTRPLVRGRVSWDLTTKGITTLSGTIEFVSPIDPKDTHDLNAFRRDLVMESETLKKEAEEYFKAKGHKLPEYTA